MLTQEKCIEKLQNQLSDFHSEIETISHIQDGMKKLAFWGAQYFLKLLQDNKVFTNSKNIYHISDIKQQLELLPCYLHQLDSLLEILVRIKLINSPEKNIYQLLPNKTIKFDELIIDKKRLSSSYPELNSNIDFLHSVLENYLLILSGKENFINILFRNGSFDAVVDLYENNLQSKFYNHLTANVAAYFADNLFLLKGIESVNILELGSGIGSTSRQLLPILSTKKNCNHYHYTDISKAFLAYGQRQFKEYFDFIVFSKFDINQVYDTKEFQKNYYDIILASNVIHNAHDIIKTLTYINTLLRPGGVLILNEGIIRNDYATLIYGLSLGWWEFIDSEWRIPGSPLIELAKWKELFSVTSFKCILSVNKLLNLPKVMNQDVIVGVK